MHFVLFPAESEDGTAIVDPTREGVFTIVLLGQEFAFRLPLGSILPPKYDPATDEQFPGNFNYNPYTGTELSIAAPQ